MNLKRSFSLARRELQSSRNPRSREVESEYPKLLPSRRSARSCVVKTALERGCNEMPEEEATYETKTSSEYNPGKSLNPPWCFGVSCRVSCCEHRVVLGMSKRMYTWKL